MKEFFRHINWKKFWNWELGCFLIVVLLYINSLFKQSNTFPENIYIIFLIPALFAFMIFIKIHSEYLHTKIEKHGKDN